MLCKRHVFLDLANLLPPPSPPQTPPAVSPPRHLLRLPEELQEKIWRLTLPDFRVHRVIIKIQSSYDEWCEPEPEDWPGLEGLETLYLERPIYRWRQIIESPRRPAGLGVCRDIRRIILSFFREFPRRRIRHLVQNDEGQNRFLDIDALEGDLNVGLCNPETDMLFIDGSSAMFPLNLRNIPVMGVSVQVEKVGGVGPSLACDHLARIVAPHYTPRLLHITAVYAWRMNPHARHVYCDVMQFPHYGRDDGRITIGEHFEDKEVTRLDENDMSSHTTLVLSTMPMEPKGYRSHDKMSSDSYGG
ncbi:uncharacterized protein FSUBG_13294 [Fusarium subglutinans]|uniref:2EXR domain-containing protein n=1 Tax=Gibberella subglutinans TaxID=42677 RepID=A0A8H5KUI7_GIBSU|nr:uncharacterized protein FSUBG_13294 [Fusarium subglutinans]KAF5580829.1 hypothetical protein FSUBG_13294 [Fusarium subglutinans]